MKTLHVIRTFLISVTVGLFFHGASMGRVARSTDAPVDARLNFTEMAVKYGSACEEYDVTTTDGYVLKVFRLRGDTKRPVLLVHGLFGTADDYIVRGNTSLAITLSRAGDDVWLANYRGNRYSRRHTHLVPDDHPAFWNFGPHEHACYDLATTIDFVLEKTGQKNLTIIGLSEGTTVTFILTSFKPEYNEKIKVFIAMAPVVFLSHLPSPLTQMIQAADFLNAQLQLFKKYEIFGFYSLSKAFLEQMCSQTPVGFRFCMNNLIFPLVGFNPTEYEADFIAVLFGHFPAGTSKQNLMQFASIAQRRAFSQPDYGAARNLAVYGSTTPPRYNLSRVMVDTHLLTSRNDRLSTLRDVATLKRMLPSTVQDHRMESPTFSHLDFIWGREGHQIAAQTVLQILKNYD